MASTGSDSLTDSRNISVNKKIPFPSESLIPRGNATFFQINSFYSSHHLYENEGKLHTLHKISLFMKQE